MKCINLNIPEVKALADHFGEMTASEILDLFPDKIPTILEAKQAELRLSQINYSLKASKIITDSIQKILSWWKNISNKDTFWNKLQQDLKIPKEQINLLRESEGNTFEEKFINFVANYSYTVEINISKEEGLKNQKSGFELEQTENNRWVVINYRTGFNKYFSSKIEAEEYINGFNQNLKNTEYYSNLTVPGGTNYTESEIAVPQIVPAIKGHAQFSTATGIGWFRSDDKALEDYSADPILMQYSVLDRSKFANSLTSTKTRRILEVQSDLFQKSRDKVLISKSKEVQEYQASNGKVYKVIYNTQLSTQGNESGFVFTDENNVPLYDSVRKVWNEKPPRDAVNWANSLKNTPGNQFLQLLNKDNSWVTFFVKSIIQDSAKKGYEKVLFPTGNTASKVEGHSTLEQVKKNIEKDIELVKKASLKIREFEIFPDSSLGIKAGKEYVGENETILLSIGDKINFSESFNTKDELNASFEKEKNEKLKKLNSQLERIETEGFGALAPIYKFYEETVTNILKKQGYNPILITDEYGNTWNEVVLSKDSSQEIYLNKNDDKANNKINKHLLETIKTILTNSGISLEGYERLLDDLGEDVNGIADTINKAIKYVYGKESVLTEEMAHFIIEALQEGPILERLLQLARQSNLYAEEYATYERAYGVKTKDPVLLERKIAKEIAGKLLAKAINKTHSEDRNFLTKFFATIKAALNWIAYKLRVVGGPTAIETEIVKTFGVVAKDVLTNKTIKPFEGKEVFLSKSKTKKEKPPVDEKETKELKLLRKAIEVLHKKIRMYEVAGGKNTTVKRDKDTLEGMHKQYKDLKAEEGLRSFIDRVSHVIESFESVDFDGNTFDQARHKFQYADAYYPVLVDIREAIKNSPQLGKLKEDKYLEEVDRILSSIESMKRSYISFIGPKFAQFLIDSGLKMSVEDAMEMLVDMKGDISWLTKTLADGSIADNEVAKIWIKRISEIQSDSRNAVRDDEIDLNNLLEEFEKANFKQEQLRNGLYLVNEIDYEKFFQSRAELYEKQKDPKITEEEFKKIAAKWYEDNMVLVENYKEKMEQLKQSLIDSFGEKLGTEEYETWYAEHVKTYKGEVSYIKDGRFNKPNPKNFENKEFTKNYKNPAFKNLYDKYVQVMIEANNKMPITDKMDKYGAFLLPQVQRGTKELLLASKDSNRSKLKEIAERLKESTGFKARQYDTEYGLTNEANEQVSVIPLYFTRKLTNPAEMTNDVVFALKLFAHQADSYKRLKSIEATLLAGMYYMRAKTKVSKNNGTLKNALSFFKGGNEDIKFPNFEETNIFQMLLHIIDTQLYGKFKKEEFIHVFGRRIDAGKLADFILRYSSLNALGLNLYAPIASKLNGSAQAFINAVGGLYGDTKDYWKAEGYVNSQVAAHLTETSGRTLKSKFMVFMDYHNVVPDMADDSTLFSNKIIRSADLGFTQAFNRLAENSAYFINAVMVGKSLRLIDGKWTYLKDYKGDQKVWDDAPNYFDQFNVDDKGKVVTSIDPEVRKSFEARVRGINDRMQGARSNLKSPIARTTFIGRLLMNFRTFAPYNFYARYGKKQFNYEMDSLEEGFHRTGWRYYGSNIKILFKKLLRQQIADNEKMRNWIAIGKNEDMTQEEKANVRKFAAEMAYMTSLLMLGILIMSAIDGDDEDDKNKSYMINMLAYHVNRQYTEFAAYLPIIGTQEALKLFNSPIPAMSTINNINDLAQSVLPWNWREPLQAGKYKGWYVWEKELFQTIPTARNIKNWFVPDDLLAYFNK